MEILARQAEDGVAMKMQKQDRQRRFSETNDLLGPNSQIGSKLRQYYDELVKEEIPDRFSNLLNELEKKEQADSAKGE